MAVSVREVIGLVISLVIIGALVPTGFSMVVNVTSTGWDAGTIAMWVLIPLIAIVGLFLQLIPHVGKK